MVQLELFDRPAVRPARRIERVEPAPGKAVTSRLAAESLRGQPALNQRERVLLAIIDAGRAGATREELAEQTGIRLASICGRVNELLRVGLVQEDGRTRLNESNREAAVVTAMEVR